MKTSHHVDVFSAILIFITFKVIIIMKFTWKHVKNSSEARFYSRVERKTQNKQTNL